MNFYANILEGKENKGPVIGDDYFLQTKEEIENWLDKIGITDYTINNDLTVDVDNVVSIYNRGLTKIHVKFGIVEGAFLCYSNKLTSLKGCPEVVKGKFDCSHNQISSLEYCPKKVGGDFYCDNNELTSLKFSPKIINENFNCSHNNINSLKYCPEVIKSSFDCSMNELTSLEFCPEEIGDGFDCSRNELTSLKYCPKIIKGFFNCSNNKLTSFEFMGKAMKSFNFYGNKFKSTEFLSTFDVEVATSLINYYPSLSWFPIKNILRPVMVKSFGTEIVTDYIKLIKGEKINNTDKFISSLYEFAYKEDKNGNFHIFCQAILKELEEMGYF